MIQVVNMFLREINYKSSPNILETLYFCLRLEFSVVTITRPYPSHDEKLSNDAPFKI